MERYYPVVAMVFAAMAPDVVLAQPPSSSTSSVAVEETSPNLELVRTIFKTVIAETGPDLTAEKLASLTGADPEPSDFPTSSCCIDKTYIYKLPGEYSIWYQSSTSKDDDSSSFFRWNYITNPDYNLDRTDCLTLRDIADDARSSGWTDVNEGAMLGGTHGFYATKDKFELHAEAGGGAAENERNMEQVETLLAEKGCVFELRVNGPLQQ